MDLSLLTGGEIVLLRSLLTAILLAAVLPADAGAVIVTYTDRATWLADAASAGLTVSTDDFSSSPGTALTLAGATFSVSGSYDAVNEYQQTFIGATFNLTGGTTLFGYGVDVGAELGTTVTATVRGVDTSPDFGGVGAFFADMPTFLGILADFAIDPACPGINCQGGPEILLTGQGGTSIAFADNLSVAYVPEPGTLPLLATGMLALGFFWRRLPR